jgi:hypothetical protein
MVDDAPVAADDIALVPGELRGYRQFSLKDDGLYPLVHTVCGPWDGRLQRAVCASGARHAAPAPDCLCGLYAWYLPGSATVSLGPVSAVVLARGRCVLGDRGFRAAAARIEAVSLPATVRWHPGAAARARAMLAQRYPQTRVYPSTRRMLRDHPPQDVSSLGVTPPRDRSRAYRAAAAVLWTAFVLGAYALVVVPRAAVADAAAHWWPVLVLLTIGWQAALVWLFLRMMAEQMPSPRWGRKER